MPSTISVDRFRLSLVWSETNLGLLYAESPAAVPFGFLGDADSFAKTFDDLSQGADTHSGLELPWYAPAGQHFWEFYLTKEGGLDKIKGKDALRSLVPFRRKIPVTVTAPGFKGRALVESFYYPHGFTLVITLNSQKSNKSRKSHTLEEAVALAFAARKREKLSVTWDGRAEEMYLVQLADKCLSYTRTLALGPAAASGVVTANDPFSVFTVITGGGVDPLTVIANGGEIHRALEAVTEWPAGYLKVKLPNLDEGVMLPLGTASDGDMVYARKRGRAVWFPRLFTDGEGEWHLLSCYHRNLVFTSMQVESLCSFARATAEEVDGGRFLQLNAMHRSCSAWACDILGRMYGNTRTTYRSLSPRYQIEQNGFVEEIDKVRAKHGRKPLSKSERQV